MADLGHEGWNPVGDRISNDWMPADDGPLGVVSLEDQVLARLRRSILAGALPVGARMTIREISDQYGVSRTPVRTAIKQLQSEGLVAVTPRSHIEVTGLSREDLTQVNAIRSVLEGLAVQLSTNHSSQVESSERSAWLARVHQSLERLEEADGRDDLDAFVVHHNDFHLLLDSGNGNARLLKQILQIYDYIAYFRKVVFAMPQKREESMQQHREIFEFVKSGDAKRAEEATKIHICGLDPYLADLSILPSQALTE